MSLLTDMLAALDRWGEWKRMREAPDRIEELERRIAALEETPRKAPGKHCPACGEPVMRRTSSKLSRTKGHMGVRDEEWTCAACGEVDRVMVLPKG